ncbi:MAG: hypothetical protein ACRCWW_10215 [Scandinavium sp.]|uniref:hypothetical protein n=1 Tax=Scandinavium sp. TaxID=2830653 RepID=UPI003F418298
MVAVYHLTSPDGLLSGRVDLQGGRLSALDYGAGHTQKIPVLFQAHWLDKPSQSEGLPPLLQHLSGEWVGVPFGCAEASDALFSADSPHGAPANESWECVHSDKHSIQLSYRFQPGFPLRELSRSISLQNDGVVAFSLKIGSAKACRFPLGIHPVFPVGGEAGNVLIETGGHDKGITYPKATEPGVSRLSPGQTFKRLTQVATTDGGYCDISALPLPYATEEIVQLIYPQKGIALRYPQRRLRVALTWDTAVLPHCLLWISNGGRQFAPWNGQNVCLGVEPVCSAWDLGPVSLASNLLQETGAATFISLGAEDALTLNYQLRCSADH